MCGRAALTATPDDLRDIFGVDAVPDLQPRYNIAPTQPLPIVRAFAGDAATTRHFAQVRWGLVPWWSRDAPRGLLHARAESIAQKPAFRDAFQRKRCLVVVDGFYEWQARGKAKQPFVVRRADGKPFALAGLWDAWTSNEGEILETAAVVTVPSPDSLAFIHDRMPLVLSQDEHDPWLAGDDPARAIILRYVARGAASGEALVARAVSTHVNSPANDDPRCLAPPSRPKLFD